MTKVELVRLLSDMGYKSYIEDGIVICEIPSKSQQEYERKARQYMRQVKKLEYHGSFGCRPYKETGDV